MPLHYTHQAFLLSCVFSGSSSHCFIDRLPNELLSEVFSLLSNNELSDGAFVDLWHVEGVTLQCVCSRWNQVALSTPALWSSIEVVFGIPDYANPTDADRKRVLKRREWMSIALDALFKRSRNASLDMVIDVDEYQSAMPPLLAQLWTTGHRWRSLHIHLADRPTFDWEMLCDSLKYGMPRLKSVYFHADDVDLLNILGRHAPNLRSLTMNSLDAGFLSARVLPQVKEVEFVICVGEEDRTAILNKLPNVETVNIHVAADCSEPSLIPYCLPKSCHSTIFSLNWDINSHDLQMLMNCVEAPSVTNITVCAGPEYVDEDVLRHPMAGIKAFILQSSCKVTHFTIQELPLTWDELAIPLQVMSETLTTFKFSLTRPQTYLDTCSTSLDRLSTILLPRLEDVEICLAYTMSVPNHTIVAIATWWGNQPTVKQFTFQVSVNFRWVDPRAFDSLAAFLRTRGVTTEITSCTRIDWVANSRT